MAVEVEPGTGLAIYTRPATAFGAFELDCTVRETHSFSARMTELPIEDGSTLSDHRQLLPPSITIDGITGSPPLRSDTLFDDTGKAIQSDLSLVVTPREAFDQLVALYETDLLFDAVTTVRTYPDMHIESLTISRDKNSSGFISFSATLKHVEVATLEGVQVVPLEQDAPVIAPKVSSGKQETKPIENADRRSAILHLIQVMTGALKVIPGLDLALPVPGAP